LDSKSKNYRASKPESPSYSSAVTNSVRKHYKERISDKSKGLYTSSKDSHREKDRRDERRYKNLKDRERDRDHDRERDRKRSRSEGTSHRSHRSHRYREDPETPRYYDGKAGTSNMSKSTWDDDDEDELKYKKKKSSWDFPTPNQYKSRLDDSSRSSRSTKSFKKYEDDTPRATPAHKYNRWAADRKHSGATPRVNTAVIQKSHGKMMRTVICGKKSRFVSIASGIIWMKDMTTRTILFPAPVQII
jgi:pre-mRNA-splicing factor ATP-dependent RNA helicase DHX38/PRP16